MKTPFLFFLCLIFALQLSAQNTSPVWSVATVGKGTGGYPTHFYLTKFDPTGNVFVMGMIADSVDYDPGPEVAYPLNSGYRLLASFNPQGQLRWSRWIPGILYVSDCETDAKGNIYLAGQYSNWLELLGDSTAPPAVYGKDQLFILKINSHGKIQWIDFRSEEKGTSMIFSIDVDSKEQVYALGYYRGKMDLLPGEDSLMVESVLPGYGCFMTKYDSKGKYVWSKTWETSSFGEHHCNTCGLLNDSVLFVANSFLGLVDLDPDSNRVVIPDSGQNVQGTYIAFFNTEGNYLTHTTVTKMTYDHPIVVNDDFGHICFPLFGQDAVQIITPSQSFDIPIPVKECVLVQLDQFGELRWYKKMPTAPQSTSNIAVTDDGSMYMNYLLQDTIADFSELSGHADLVEAYQQNAILKIDSNGLLQDRYLFACPSIFDDFGISSGPNHRVAMSGNIQDTLNIAFTDSVASIPCKAQTNKGFILCWEEKSKVSDSTTSDSCMIYPNPTHGLLNLAGRGLKRIRVMDLIGQSVFHTILNSDLLTQTVYLPSLSPGIFLYTIETQSRVFSGKIQIE